MKAIINGKRYDTETATKLGEAESRHYRNDFHWWREELYRTKSGRYFLDGEGNGLSHYAEPCGNNGYTNGYKIVPLSKAEAFAWAERHGLTDLLESEFADQVEDA